MENANKQDLSKLFLHPGDSLPVENYRTLADTIKMHKNKKNTVRLEFSSYSAWDKEVMIFHVIAIEGNIQHKLYGTYGVNHENTINWINEYLSYFGVSI